MKPNNQNSTSKNLNPYEEKETNHINSPWVIDGCYIKTILDNILTIVPAIDIYKSEFTIDGYNPPSKSLANILFQKFSLIPKLIVDISEQDQIIQAKIRVALFKHEIEICSAHQDLNIDHIIINNNWYPILHGTLIEIIVFLSQNNLDIGELSLEQYLSITRIKHLENFIIINKLPQLLNIDKKKKLQQPIIQGFNAVLYDYQIKGFNWLNRFYKEEFGCILGDEMGLGKTMQIIALMLQQSSELKFKSLVICPASLLENWRREISKFAPSIKTVIHSGNERTGFKEVLENVQTIITSYDVLLRDIALFKSLNLNLTVCDEAQMLKNPKAQRTLAVKKLNSKCRIAVTGTPFENRIEDIWSIIDFVAPRFLGTLNEFQREFDGSISSATKLEPLISPLILRRLVKDVAKDLPHKIEISETLLMSEIVSFSYEQKREEIIRNYGKNATLISIMTLRMLCCDPELALKNGINYDKHNTKLQRLREILFEIYKSGEKAIIFTSFIEASDKIKKNILEDLNCFVKTIDGRTEIESRQDIIDEFSKISGSAFLVLNPKAAGTGLNITAANHVIHFNLEWNPAVEDQASARAYRRGQTKPVFIRRLYYANTIEEFVNNKIETKRLLANATVVGITGENSDMLDVYEALKYSPIHPTT